MILVRMKRMKKKKKNKIMMMIPRLQKKTTSKKKKRKPKRNKKKKPKRKATKARSTSVMFENTCTSMERGSVLPQNTLGQTEPQNPLKW